MPWKPLTDEQWIVIEPVIPVQHMGRPRHNDRVILDAILYALEVGCRWCDLPATFPPKSTVHHRFQLWQKLGFFKDLLEALKGYKQRLRHDLYHLDATIKSAKKGRLCRASGKNKRH